MVGGQALDMTLPGGRPDADAVRAAPAAANDGNFERCRPVATLARPVGKVRAI